MWEVIIISLILCLTIDISKNGIKESWIIQTIRKIFDWKKEKWNLRYDRVVVSYKIKLESYSLYELERERCFLNEKLDKHSTNIQIKIPLFGTIIFSGLLAVISYQNMKNIIAAVIFIGIMAFYIILGTIYVMSDIRININDIRIKLNVINDEIESRMFDEKQKSREIK